MSSSSPPLFLVLDLASSLPDGAAADQQLKAFVNENFALLETALAAAMAVR
jgi:hypothetical protein